MFQIIKNPVSCRVTWKQLEKVTAFFILVEDDISIDTDLNTNFDTDVSSEVASFELTFPKPEGGFAAIYQHKPWWIRPAFPEICAEIPQRTQLLLQHIDGEFSALLAVCDGICRADISGTKTGVKIGISTNGYPGDGGKHIALCLTHGSDPYICIHEAVSTACRCQGREYILRENKCFPELFRSFGWCTWDAFYHKVNEEGIISKLEEFREKQVPIGWMLIDDGWLDADYQTRKLNTFRADSVKFPRDIRGVAQLAKERFGVAHIGVWHSLMGYWTGFNPGSEVFLEWQENLIQRNNIDYVLRPNEETIYSFYDAWHGWLAQENGIEFVKVDGQGSGSIYYKGLASFSQSAGSYQRALDHSCQKHFSGNLINCMGMASQNMWLRETATLCRSSDDFVPKISHGFWEHAMQNSFNSLLQREFSWCDWDMFWSDHAESRQNSVLRSVSGGPIYISDPIGKTNPAYILPLLTWNQKIILCDDVGVPTMDCLLRSPLEQEKPFKIFNRLGEALVVAAFSFHDDDKPCVGNLTTSDIPGLMGRCWLAYSYFSQKLATLSDASPIPLQLPANDAELLLLLPQKKYGQFLGDLDKYVSSYGIVSQRVSEHHLTGVLEPAEHFAFTMERLVKYVLVNGKESAFKAMDGYYLAAGDCRNRMYIEIYG